MQSGKRKAKPWSTKEQAVIAAHYQAGGPEACQPYMPDRTIIQIRSWAFKHGFRRNKPSRRYSTCDVTVSKPGVSPRYVPDWAPLKPAKAPPVRPGAMDFAKLPSLT